jgi:hypothetical protein
MGDGEILHAQPRRDLIVRDAVDYRGGNGHQNDGEGVAQVMNN